MLRDYQRKFIDDIEKEWATSQNVIGALPTGAGKTYTFSTIVKKETTPTVVIAHRNELVGQMSLSLASLGVYHRIIASDKAILEITKAHREQLGKVHFDPTAQVIVASVDTLLRRRNPRLFEKVGLWIIDEAHHVLRENKWGEAVSMFPNARGLGVTATPCRADGKGLGRHADGVFDALVVGPTGDELIDLGYLSPYIIANPKVDDLDLSEVETGATGDLKRNQLTVATKKSKKLIGSVVDEYQKFAKNKLGITFAVDIESAKETSERFNDAGIPSSFVSANTPFLERTRTFQKFRQGQIRELVNVDLFGEGVDVPGVDVVTMARRTESFSLYSQQLGRGLRPVYADGYDLSTVEGRKAAIANGPKPYAMIIDHVGNVLRHLLPTSTQFWTLDAREKKASGVAMNDEDKLKTCTNTLCLRPYRAILTKCPHCGEAPKASERKRGKPEEVDGDLELLDLNLIRELQAESSRLMSPLQTPNNLPQPAVLSALKKHSERMRVQEDLRACISQWAGYRRHEGLEVSQCQKLFYLRFKVDVLTAQTLGKNDSLELKQKVENDFTNMVR